MAIHPLKTTEKIRDSYINYLKTIKPFQDEGLRAEFARAIESKDMLVKGPLLQIALPYKKDLSIHGLVNEGVLSPRFAKLCSEHLAYDRLLYTHQVKAIRKVVQGRNLVVSTGTGSGKTEAFLIPILDYLLREEDTGTLSRPGVRALLLYPMNALANDQMKRLRRILQAYPQITFGRYINIEETPELKSRADDNFRAMYGDKEPFVANELKSREEMHATPPHLLVTNYAMLEFLLLRPTASPLFDGETGGQWHFIVLDEAHIYDGANATEMAMLLRRVQDRVAGERHGKIQAIATSATLGSGLQDYPKVATFASNLFNKSFVWDENDADAQDVVGAEMLPLNALGETWGSFEPYVYKELSSIVESNADDASKLNMIRGIVSRSGIPSEIHEQAEINIINKKTLQLQSYLYHLLKGEANLRKLILTLQDRPALLHVAAESVFPELEDAEEVLISLVSLAVMAKTGVEEMPLLPARYHTFARALEGAFICLNKKAHENGEPTLFLHRQKYCPSCKSRIFEIANCTRCGTSYIIGKPTSGGMLDEQPEKFTIETNNQYILQDSEMHASEAAIRTSYYVFSANLSEEDDDEVVAEGSDEDPGVAFEGLEEVYLCPSCGQIQSQPDLRKCQCEEPLLKLFKVDLGKKKTLRRCLSCSTRSSSSAVYRFLTGQDAPVSVIAGSLYEELPGSKDPELIDLPGQGRKMLNFTDSRQNAAFFAPYVERTHMRSLRRALILKTAKRLVDHDGDVRLPDLIEPLVNAAEELGLLTEEKTPIDKKAKMATWLMLDFIPLDRRISLEGLGLLSFEPALPPNWTAPPFLTSAPLSLNRQESMNLIRFTLDTLRFRGGVNFLMPDQNIYKREEFKPRNRLLYVRMLESVAVQGIFSWMPSEGHFNTRLDYLVRLLSSKGVSNQEVKSVAKEILENLWGYLTISSSPWKDTLKVVDIPRIGRVYQVDHLGWRLKPTTDDLSGWMICDRCKNIYPMGAGDICMTYFCKGHLEPLAKYKEEISVNLFRRQYQRESIVPLSAQEHTAQWTPDKAAKVQNQFIKGEVNLLSCSTTFELGVDVGELQAVLMRNVPPSNANYIQRAGRAGRRTDSAAYIMTFAQRRSHDLSHYAEPERMVSGKLLPPKTPLTNEKILRRHLHSIVFASFFKWVKAITGKELRNVGDFFDPEEGLNGRTLLTSYLALKPEALQQAITNIMPAGMHDILGVREREWVLQLTNAQETGVLDLAHSDITGELDFLKSEEDRLGDQYAQTHNHNLPRVINAISATIKTIRQKELLGFFGSRNVLPKYGFPSDVVELQTSHLGSTPEARDIELSRDLRVAISEFAPGSQVLAAKKLWTSAGLKVRPQNRWQEYFYAICKECGKFHHSIANVPTTCTSCGEPLRGDRKFVIPDAGFVASNNVLIPGEEPPARTYANEVHFADYADDLETKYGRKSEFEPVNDLGLPVNVRYSRFGWMALVNKGHNQGFKICTTCGYGEVINIIPNQGGGPWANHKNPITGMACNGQPINRDLGHRYMTDVLEISIVGLRYEHNKINAMQSMLYALLEGASISQGIRRSDIDGTLYYRTWGQTPSIILFDAVPGGAGHVENIKDHLRDAIFEAYQRVRKCECGEDTSCYNCLRNYNNQRFHDVLQRGYAINLLRQLLGNDI